MSIPAAARPRTTRDVRESSETVVQATGLVKRFGDFVALDGLDLEVHRGEVHGFLGPNGAGKSTTIRILLGLARKSGGEATLFGRDPWRRAAPLHRRLAYVPGDVTLWPGLSGGQCIDVLAEVHGGIRPDRRAQLIERFDLDPTKRARDYSKGNRQKVSLIAALAAEVELLVLDEPTSGLDPLMEQAFQEVIRERSAEGVTVLLSSHILAEVEALADRVSIIRKGRTVTSGTLADLRRHTRTKVHAVTERTPALDGTSGVANLEIAQSNGKVEVRLSADASALGDVVGAAARGRCGLPHRHAAQSRRAVPARLRRRRRGRAMSGPVITMVRIHLRTGWLAILVWVLAVAGTMEFTVAAIHGLYDTPAKVHTYAAAVKGDALMMLNGKIAGIDSLGGIVANEFGFMASFAIPFMAVSLVSRMTRKNEEQGRTEALLAGRIGRGTPLVAAIMVATVAELITTAALFASFAGVGVPTGDAALYSLSMGALGLTFVGVTALRGAAGRAHPRRVRDRSGGDHRLLSAARRRRRAVVPADLVLAPGLAGADPGVR